MTSGSGSAIEIFTEAVRLPREEREAFLDRVCAGDEGLRRKIEALIKSNDRAGDFLERPAHGEDGPKTAPGERPGDQVDRYKLLKQIGEGGCGIVFLAEQEIPVRRRVALKIIKPGMDTKSVIARFEAERQALAVMDHPNVARVFDAGATDRGRPFFVMELVEGMKITDYCNQFSSPTGTRLELFIQCCDAIQHAHQKGIIHRDIKPSNILVASGPDGKPTLKVIDFGIAKATAGQQLTDKTIFTAHEMLIGTPAYMSPEQAALSTTGVDTRTDIYSLGVLLYELLTGKTPFDAHELLKSGFDEVRRVIREEEPIRPSIRLTAMNEADFTLVCQRHHEEPATLLRRLRGDLDWIVMKALEKDRARRYETATGLLKDVQRFLAGDPVSARPPSKRYKFQKAVLRNKLLFSGIGVIALLLSVGLIVVSASLEKERRARREAEAATIESQQVTKFLEDALQGVGPSYARGEDTTMLRGILDRAVARVGTELTNQPAEEAELRNVIGTVYRQIGNYREAEGMHRAAIQIRRTRFGSDDPTVAMSLNELGYDLQGEHKTSEAGSVFSEALAMRQRLFGMTNAATITSLNDLSTVYRDEGNLGQAAALARQALAIRQRLFGQTNLDVADSLRNLSIILGDQGKWAQSEAESRQVLAIRRQLLGPEHPEIATALDDVAWAADAQGKLKEAESLRREALAIRQKLLPPMDPDLAQSLHLVGDSMRRNGDVDNAYSVLSAALSIQRVVLGKDDPASIDTLHDLGLTLEAEGKWGEAETVNSNVLALWIEREGTESPHTMYAMSDLGLSLENEHKWAEAESVDRASWALSWKILGGDEPHTLYLMDHLTAAFEADGKWPDAESACRQALGMLRSEAGDHHDPILHTMWLLDSILQGEGKWPQQESNLREELALLLKVKGDAAPDTLHTMGTLGYVLKNEHKWADAESIDQQALARWRKLRGDDDPETLYAMRNLAETFQDEGKLSEVENLYREESETWRKLNGDEDQQTFYTRRMLGWTLEAEGKWPQAETVFRQTLALSRKKGDEDPEAMADLQHLVLALMPQKKFGDAEQLLDKVLTPQFVNNPSSASLLIQRVNLMGRQERWREATADAGSLLRIDPTDPYHYHRLAALYAISQNRSSYEEICGKMVVTFTNTANPYVDERIADDCLLLPHSGVDPGLAANFANLAVTRGSNEPAVAYFQACKAMSDYRLGHYTEAIAWSSKATSSPTAEIQAKAKAFAILAMANWQLGRKDAARAALLKGDSLTPRASPETGPMDLGESWVAWLMARISLDEATSLINAASLAGGKPTP